MRTFEPSEFESIVKIGDFWVTDEPMVDGPPLNDIEEDLYYEARSPNKNTPAKLIKAIEEHPEIRPFYSHLANAYRQLGNNQKFREMAKKTYEKFPDYEYGRVLMAEICLEDKKLDNIATYLGSDFSLATFDPKQKVFHSTFVRSYFYLLARYAYLKERSDLLERATTVLDHEFLEFPSNILKPLKLGLSILQTQERLEAIN